MATLPEIPRRLRSLVDTCFEEFLYDAGIAILDKIRTPNAIPSLEHVRQLLYLALYPPSVKPKEIKKPAPKRRSHTSHQVPEILPPEPGVADLAIDTLYHLLRTNSVQHILRALPSYDVTLGDDSSDVVGNPLAYHAACITQAKHCWEMLAPNFIRPESRDPVLFDDAVLIADHAWPVFEWLVDAFERDGKGGVSTMLASQLPKSSGGPKMVLDVPLDLIFTAFALPSDHRRIDASMRLLSLLISLTRTTPPIVSPDRLASETCRRLTDIPLPPHKAFMVRLEDSHFKAAITVLYLERNCSAKDAQLHFANKAKSRSHVTSAESKHPTGYPLPSAERVLEMIILEPETSDNGVEEEGTTNPREGGLKYALMKLQLLGAVNDLKLTESDEAWTAVHKKGLLRESIDKGFPNADDKALEFRQDAFAYIDWWMFVST